MVKGINIKITTRTNNKKQSFPHTKRKLERITNTWEKEKALYRKSASKCKRYNGSSDYHFVITIIIIDSGKNHQ